jgi:acyl-CoA dehydrogenase
MRESVPPAAPASPFYTAEHEAFRDTLRRFVAREIAPYVDEWDEAGEFPRELYRKASAIGLLQLGYPEEYGGVPTDPFYRIVVSEELAKAGSGGVNASLMSHSIGAPPIAALGPEWMKRKVLPEILSGEKISALAITEPSGGSDVANLRTTARREGDHYIVNGQKMFITSGFRADYFTVAVRTGGPGAGGVSLLLIERDRPGFSRTKLRKMGWWASDTAQLFFDDCKVPVENLIGEENRGFIGIMLNFNQERIGLAAGAHGFARVCLDEAIAYARERHTFGKPLIANQVIRHKIVDMAMKVNAVKANLEMLAWRVHQGERPVAEICMLKNLATTTLEYVANEAMQIFGGAGYLRGSKVERIYRETKVMTIGGGSLEIMKDLAARQMGL